MDGIHCIEFELLLSFGFVCCFCLLPEIFCLLTCFLLASSMDKLYSVALILHSCEDRTWDSFWFVGSTCAAQSTSHNMCVHSLPSLPLSSVYSYWRQSRGRTMPKAMQQYRCPSVGRWETMIEKHWKE